MDDEKVGIEVEPAEKAVGSEVYDPEEWSSEPLRDPKTGRWIKGTGGSRKGGRPVGARDKITTTMIRLAEETAAEYGQEMFEKLARTDPAACLALITRLLPNPDLSKAIAGESEQDDALTQISINLISKAPSQAPQLPTKVPSKLALPDPVSPHSENDIGRETPSDSGPEPSESTFEGSVPLEGELMSDRAEVEAIRERNERIRAHGGRVGPKRRDRSNEIQYPDDPNIV